ncbi:cytochrome c oxidase subunit II [Pedobacter segetis]|nr:cytochrome c oxidase subunit II [Pedobacter segetis]
MKKIFSLFALIALAFNQVMAQDTVAGAAEEVSKTDGLAKMVGYYLLLFLLLCIFIGIVGKILQVYDLTKKIQGKKEGIKWNNINGLIFAVFLVLGLYGAYWCYTVQGAQILPDAASIHGAKIDSMLNVTLILTTIVFVITHILLFTFAYRYKFNRKKKAYYYPHNNTLEKYWTITPAIVLTILVLMGFFTWRGITNISKSDMASAIQIDVTAHQFAWEVRYAGKDNVAGNKNYKLIGSLNGLNTLGLDLSDKRNYDDLKVSEIVLPVNKSVRFTLGSQDVIHSFYMPDFRVQMNCVPGMATFFQFTPTITTAEMREKTGNPKYNYKLYCAKICGASHYNMQFAVRVVSEKEYKEWIKQQKPIVTEDMKKQYQLAMKDNLAPKNNKIALNN